MSYHGTVTCSYCRNRGHNRSSCEAMTAQLRKRFEQYKAEGYDSDAYTLAEQIGTRTGINPLSGKKVNQRSNRRCSYCKYKFGDHCPEGKGHTRRTCIELKKDKSDMERRNVEYRKTVSASLKDLGLGVGALVKRRVSGYYTNACGEQEWDRRELICLVHTIRWDKINVLFPREHSIVVMPFMHLEQKTLTMGLPRLTDSEGDEVAVNVKGWVEPVGTWDVKSDLVSSINGEKIKTPTDEKWLNGSSPSLDHYFNEIK